MRGRFDLHELTISHLQLLIDVAEGVGLFYVLLFCFTDTE